MKRGEEIRSQRTGEGSGNLLLAIYSAAAHSGVVNTYYEKNCFVLNHGPNRHRVCRFLHATTGNNGNFDRPGDHESLAVAYTEETHGEEESTQDRGVAIHHRIACAHTLKEKAEVRG